MVGPFLAPSLEQSFGTQWHGPRLLSAFMYDVSNAVLYPMYYGTQNYDVLLGVPLSLAQQYAVADRQLGGSYHNPNIPWPDALFTLATQNQFKQCLLTEFGAPILDEDGTYLTVN
jgi:hypothetical protein